MMGIDNNLIIRLTEEYRSIFNLDDINAGIVYGNLLKMNEEQIQQEIKNLEEYRNSEKNIYTTAYKQIISISEKQEDIGEKEEAELELSNYNII